MKTRKRKKEKGKIKARTKKGRNILLGRGHLLRDAGESELRLATSEN